MKHRNGVIGVFLFWLVTMLTGPALADLIMGSYTLISKTRVSRVAFDYTYRADVTNTGAEVENVTAELSSRNPNTLIVDGNLSFGAVGAGATVTSADTFTIRQDRQHPFNWANMSWDISFDIPVPEGVLLQGDPDGLAVSATVSLFSHGVASEDILDYVILNRLSIMIDDGATVAEVNQALLDVNGRITDMDPGSVYMEVAIPRQPTTSAVGQIADQLAASPAILFAFPAQVPKPTLLPPEHTDFLRLDSLQHLLPARFPAAWNAAGLIEFDADGSCTYPVTVLVADFWYTAANTHPEAEDYDSAATDQLRLDPLIRPAPGQGDLPIPFLVTQYYEGFHGYDVTSTMAARFDATPPTGAMPLTECLDLVGVPVNGYSWPRTMRELRRRFPESGKFLINASLGFPGDDGRAADGSAITPDDMTRFSTPLRRAVLAAQWRELVEGWTEASDRQNDFLVLSAAGNDADRANDLFVDIYPGAATAGYSNPFSVAAIPGDALFDFALDNTAWSGDGVFPDVTATAAGLAALRTRLINNDWAHEHNNVLVVGSTTNEALRDDVNLEESVFSDRGAQVYAVGEDIPNLTRTRELRGTSFSTPQVTGLTAYLWLIAPELTNERIPAFITRYLIEHSVWETGGVNSINLIDAYLAALTFDLDPDVIGVPIIQFGEAPVREAILDIDGDGLFEEDDLKRYLQAYYNGNFLDSEVLPVLPSSRNYSRFDLNGDGFTGGDSVESFDLDLLASEAVTPIFDSSIVQSVLLPGADAAIQRSFDENGLTDFEILCYYAFSPLYYGDLVGVNTLEGLTWLSDCVDIQTRISPATLGLGSTIQLEASIQDAASHTLVSSTTVPGGSEYFRWSSSNPEVATVDSRGFVHVAGRGTTTIRASYGRASDMEEITIPGLANFLSDDPVMISVDTHLVYDPINVRYGCAVTQEDPPPPIPLPTWYGGLASDGGWYFPGASIQLSDITNAEDAGSPAQAFERATGGILPPYAGFGVVGGEYFLSYLSPGFLLYEILGTGVDDDDCPSLFAIGHIYEPNVAGEPWRLWQLHLASSLPYVGDVQQPLWLSISPPQPPLINDAGEIRVRSTNSDAALMIEITGQHSVNIEAVPPWTITRSSVQNPVNDRDTIIVILEYDGRSYEIDLEVTAQEFEEQQYLEVDNLTGWRCGIGWGLNCPGTSSADISLVHP